MIPEVFVNQEINALLLEDYKSDAELIEHYLKGSFPKCNIQHVSSGKEFRRSIERYTPDIILSDFNLPNYSAEEAYTEAKKRFGEIPFILITGEISESQIVNMIHTGIDDYLMKSSLTRIGMAVGQALQRRNSLSLLKDNDQVIESNLRFVNTILEHSGMAICEVKIPFKAFRFFKHGFSHENLQKFLLEANICRVNKKVIDLFEYKDFEHFENDFAKIFDERSSNNVMKIIQEAQNQNAVKNKKVQLQSFKGHRRHIDLNLVSQKSKNFVTVILNFLDETSRLESEMRTEKLLQRMEKTIFESTKELRSVNQKLNEQAEHTKRINKVLEYNFNQTTASIQAAKKIQKLMLPKMEQIRDTFTDAFVFYKAKDIVSGDFYWCQEVEDTTWVALADCTGHGVPGALMAMTGAHLLSEIVNGNAEKKPNDILCLLDQHIIDRLKQREIGNIVSTGMDITLCKFCKATNQLEFSGAYQDLFLKIDNKMRIIKGVRRGVGGTHEYKDEKFCNHTVQLKKGDKLYFTSDGMPDQFGGEFGKKLMKKRFVQLLENFSSKDMNGELLEVKKAYYKWKRKEEQVDDIVVMGLEV